MSKDRLSIHLDNGGNRIDEALTIMRDGGTVSQSGLVGITNIGYLPGSSPIIPETVFNVQSRRASDIRFSSGASGVRLPDMPSSIQLFGNGNEKASGLQITYLPYNDTAYWEGCTTNCDNDGSQFYRRYTLEKCDDQTFVDVIDRTFIRPAVGSVVNYTDSNSNSSCATVNSYILIQDEDGASSINSVYQDCVSCEGGSNNDTTIYEILICGGTDGAQIYAEDPNGINPNVGQTVKYNDPQTGLQCGEVLSVTTGQSNAYITESYDDCDECENPPEPPGGNTVYQVTNCVGGATEYVEDNTSVSPQSGKIYGYNDGGGVVCATIVGVTNNTATKTGFVATQYDDCSSCDNSNNPTQTLQYTIGRCYDQTILDVIEDPFGVAPAVNAIVGYYDGTDVYCGQVISTAFGNQLGTSTYIRTLYTSCDSCNDNTNGGGTSGGGGSGGGGTNSGGGTGTQAGEYIFKVNHWYYPQFCNANINDACDPCCTQTNLWVASGSIDPSTIDLGYRVSFTYAGLALDDELKVGFIKESGINDGSQAVVGNITCVGSSCGGAGSPICDECELQPPGGGGGFGFVNDPYNMSDMSIAIGDQEKNVVDFSMVRASGTEGIEFGHLSITERGYVGIGLTKIGDVRKFTANAPLTVAYMANNHRDSGTISMKEQSSSPSNNGFFGKIYVKPFTTGGRSQALYFKDDSGVETNLILSQDININKSTDGLIYGDVYENTYGGWHTPKSRSLTTGVERNTYYGQSVGFDLIANNSAEDSTLIGFSAGSGAILSSGMTVVGSNSFVNYGKGAYSVIIGHNNVKSSIFVPSEDPGGEPVSGVIIGTNLYVNSDPPTGVLAIGHGLTPVVTGQLTGANRTFAIDDAEFIVSTGDSNFTISQAFSSHYDVKLTAIDETNTLNKAYRNSVNVNFSNAGDFIFNMAEFNPSGAERVNVPTYASQGFNYMQLNSDFRLQGAIRFQDGSSLSGVDSVDINMSATSGVNRANSHYVLDFSELALAGDVSNNIRTDNTFLAVQLDGSSSANVGKMSLQGIADYVSSGTASIAENCNVIISNPENELSINGAANAQSVIIGCDVATNASGWKNSVIIGTEAGQNATTPNPTLDTDTSSVFIGYKAGRDCDSVDNVIAIGSNAANEADGASDSIFIGGSAGFNSKFKDSVGLGVNSLRGSNGIGSGNIEIVANMLDNQTLFSNAGTVNYKLNIQNSIAGDTNSRNISIGAARLNAESPLEARRDSNVHANNSNQYIQSWVCDNTVVGAVECDGSLSGFFVEGVLDGNLTSPADANSSTTATLSVYYNGADTGTNVTVTNRNHGAGTRLATSYLLAVRVGGEYRPI